jgi:antitoxin (DNA-binding transcriptional repressor) of toxin-antitoxin stability system
LERSSAGEVIEITRHGRPYARLGPPGDGAAVGLRPPTAPAPHPTGSPGGRTPVPPA